MKRSSILFAIVKGDKNWWDISAKDQEIFIKAISEPRNNVERSYAQYLCQTLFVPKWKIWLRNFIATIIIPFQVIFCLFNSLRVSFLGHKDAIGNFKLYPEIVPESLMKEYELFNDLWCNKHIMTTKDLSYIIRHLFSYSLHPYFCFKNIYNISNYSYYLKRYKPKAIICHAEFSCTSSILTDYCNEHGVKHIDVMHGEKLFFIRDSFFHYDKCYVWNDYYKNLFVSMRAEPTQFIIEKPRIFNINVSKKRNKMFFANYKYYLQIPTNEEMRMILKSMEFVKRQGLSIKYRLHPNHLNESAFKMIPSDEIENPFDVDIETSIASCENVVGSYTTVLIQAYFSGINVIVDDVTYRERYNQLKDYKYILSNMDSQNLSEYQFKKDIIEGN